MNAYLESAYLGATFNGPRSRQAELYFNSVCLFRVLLNRNWEKARVFCGTSSEPARNDRRP